MKRDFEKLFRSNGSRSARSMKLIRAFHLLALQLVEFFIKSSRCYFCEFSWPNSCVVRWPREQAEKNKLFSHATTRRSLSRRKARRLSNRGTLKARTDRRRDDDTRSPSQLPCDAYLIDSEACDKRKVRKHFFKATQAGARAVSERRSPQSGAAREKFFRLSLIMRPQRKNCCERAINLNEI